MQQRAWIVAIIVLSLVSAACNLGSSDTSPELLRAATDSASMVKTPAPLAPSPQEITPTISLTATDADIACDSKGCISLKKFSANIDSKLQNAVVGYVSIIGINPIISSYGPARTSANPPSEEMGPDVPINIASLSKVPTTIAALKLIANHHMTIDDKIEPYLPPDWVKGPNIDTITFKELLTHTAGFRYDESPVDDFAGLQKQITIGIKLDDKAKSSYDNLNFGLFRVLLPYIEGFKDPGPAKRARAVANAYVDIVRRQVFQPLGIDDADCKPAAGTPHTAIFYPTPPVGSFAGLEDNDQTLLCGGGGWVLTANELYMVLFDLMRGNKLLTDSEKAQMNDLCLGWDCSVGPQVDFVGKNGGLNYIYNNHSVGVTTFFGIFKGSIPVVVVINSLSPQNITTTVVNAFRGAKARNP